jgi:O-antigen ligase
MLNQSGRKLFKSYHLQLHLAIVGGVGLLLGAASLWFSPLLTLVVLAIVVLVFATLKRPEIALLGILIATSSVIFEDRLPLIPIGIGSLHISDVILLALLGLIVLRWLVENDFDIVRTPLDLPLLIFFSIALISTSIAMLQSSVDFTSGVRAIRGVTYYLTFFIVTNLIREERQLRLLLRGLSILAIIVAFAMIFQFLGGESKLLIAGNISTLEVSGKVFIGTTRIVPSGISLVLVSFITLTAMLCMGKYKIRDLFGLFQWILLGIALMLTFLRSYWVVIGVALFLLAYLNEGQGRRRFISWGLVIVLLTMVILMIVFDRPDSQMANLVRGSFTRLSTLWSTKTLGEDSLQWRFIENEYALEQIISHPLLGLGMGARYRPFDPRLDWLRMDWDARQFIHNGHLWVLLSTGILGYASLMLLSARFLIRGFRNWQCISDAHLRGIVLGFTLAYLGVLIAAFVNSTFSNWAWTPVIGIMMGVSEVVFKKDHLMG